MYKLTSNDIVDYSRTCFVVLKSYDSSSIDLREDCVYDPTIISVISLLIFLTMTYRTVFLLNLLLSQ